MKATWRGATLAESDQTIVVEGNHYFPPDSLVNTKVIPHATPVIQVVGMMRNFTADLGVRCQFCHVGVEGQPLAEFDFAIDQKRTKLVARQMMFMVQEINRRVDSLPGRKFAGRVQSLAEGTGATFALLPPDNATGNFTKVVQRVSVKVVFDDKQESSQLLRSGLSAVVSITTKSGATP